MADPYSSYPSRTKSFAAGDQVPSSDLNAIQDGIIACSENLDDLAGQVVDATTGSGNMADSPAPDESGGFAVWFEKSTNGTTPVVLDANHDWRDRYVVLNAGRSSGSTYLPGGVDDDSLFANNQEDAGHSITGIFYTQAGSAAGTAGMLLRTQTLDYILFYARSTDGALMVTKSANADGDTDVFGRAEASPRQNHH